MQAKKIVNDPRRVVPELIDGVIAAYGGLIRKLGERNALVKSELPRGKVGLLVGGGSGHEPLFAAFIGANLPTGRLTATPAAPTPDTVLGPRAR
jgi:dihydroxyacetone kinase-like protein